MTLRRKLFEKTILENKWIPATHRPTPKQAEFLLLDCFEALYGGAAGGGKTEALLMGALQYVDVPGYSAILLRRSLQDLELPDGLIPRSMEWLGGTEAKWEGRDNRWTFPSTATLGFGYLMTERDKYHYGSSAFQYIGWEELTQFRLSEYLYMMSRVRRLKDSHVPLRVRGTSNPGNIGHEWVKLRFIVEGPSSGRGFVPARLDDNPHIDRASYVRNLMLLDPVTREQLLNGNWEIEPGGTKFRREWFGIVNEYPREAPRVRYWDLASTTPRPGRDPDWTAGALVALHMGCYYIVDIRRIRDTPQRVESLVRLTAELDGRETPVGMEQEPGSSGVAIIDHYAREVLVGYSFRGYRTTGSKVLRADPVSSAAQAGNVKLVWGSWISDWLNEAEAFPGGSHDDQADAVSGAVTALTSTPARPRYWSRVF